MILIECSKDNTLIKIKHRCVTHSGLHTSFQKWTNYPYFCVSRQTKAFWHQPIFLVILNFPKGSLIQFDIAHHLCLCVQGYHRACFGSSPQFLTLSMAGRSGGATRPNGATVTNKICQFKLVLLGESAVGKSSLVLRFVKGQFHEFQESTIGGSKHIVMFYAFKPIVQQHF